MIKRVGDSYLFYCEGCRCNHMFDDGWAFNKDFEKPTVTPSLLIRSGHYALEHKGDICWCSYNAASPFECYICHSYITDGKIQYLSDCTHALAGQTMDLRCVDES